MRLGAIAALMCGGLAWAPTSTAMPGPPAGLQGLLSPPQEADGPPGCQRADTDARWPVFADPTQASTRRGWLMFHPWAGDPLECLAVTPVLESIAGTRPVPTLESGYEIPALLVLEERNGWYRIQLEADSGWLQLPPGYRFEAWPALLVGKLAYATPAWSGEWCEVPGLACQHETPTPEQPLQVLGHTLREGETWLKVELTTDGCRDGEARVIRRGWLRARDGDGRPAAWFHSRGC